MHINFTLSIMLQDVVGLLLDVGPSMGAEDRGGESCLEQCKNILSLYVQRKVKLPMICQQLTPYLLGI